MIAIISVKISRGDLSNRDHLHDLANSIYRQQISPPSYSSLRGLHDRLATMLNASAYICIPHPGSFAAFMYLNAREFEIVIETSNQGHLIRSSESVMRELRRHLKQKGMEADIEVSLSEPNDNQIYINGAPTSLLESLLSALKYKVAAVVIYLIIIYIAKGWLDQYFQEAIATLIGFLLFTLWDVITIISGGNKKVINWRIHE
jgi:hypothetical protein